MFKGVSACFLEHSGRYSILQTVTTLLSFSHQDLKPGAVTNASKDWTVREGLFKSSGSHGETQLVVMTNPNSLMKTST